MANFRVGQRVRVLRKIHPQSPLIPGDEGIIMTSEAYRTTLFGQSYLGYQVKLNRSIPRLGSSGFFQVSSDNMVPLYDGHQVIAWEDCLWKPESEKAHG